jgi:hypothetical protein
MSARDGKPSAETRHYLLTLSGNRCAFQDPQTGRGCEHVLARRVRKSMNAVI